MCVALTFTGGLGSGALAAAPPPPSLCSLGLPPPPAIGFLGLCTYTQPHNMYSTHPYTQHMHILIECVSVCVFVCSIRFEEGRSIISVVF